MGASNPGKRRGRPAEEQTGIQGNEQPGRRVHKSGAPGPSGSPSANAAAARTSQVGSRSRTPPRPRAPGRRLGSGAEPLIPFASPPCPWASPPWVRGARSKVAGGMGEMGRKEWPGRLAVPAPLGGQPPQDAPSAAREPPGTRRLVLDPAPRLRWPLPCGVGKGRGEKGFGNAVWHEDGRVRSAGTPAPTPAARIPPRPPPNPSLAAGDSSTVTLFPLGPAWGLHRRSRKYAVPGPLPC